MNRILRKGEFNVIYVTSPGHGTPGRPTNTYKGSYNEIYQNVAQNDAGMMHLSATSRHPSLHAVRQDDLWFGNLWASPDEQRYHRSSHERPLRRGATMIKAIWNGKIVAEAERTEIVEGNHYFPREAPRAEYFQPSDTQTTCPWKGTAHYYTLRVDGKENADAAWYYPSPKPAAQNIAGQVAFWKGVRIET